MLTSSFVIDFPVTSGVSARGSPTQDLLGEPNQKDADGDGRGSRSQRQSHRISFLHARPGNVHPPFCSCKFFVSKRCKGHPQGDLSPAPEPATASPPRSIDSRSSSRPAIIAPTGWSRHPPQSRHPPRHAWRSHRFLCPSAQTQARDHALQRLALLMGADATVHMEAADGWVRIIVRLPARYPDDPLPVAGSAANHSSAGAFQPSWYAICPTRSRLEFGTEVAPEEPADASWHQPSREVDASRLVHSLPMIVYPAPTVFSYLFNPFSIPPQESCS